MVCLAGSTDRNSLVLWGVMLSWYFALKVIIPLSLFHHILEEVECFLIKRRALLA